MNRLQFRIVFNKRRGQFMAAAETVKSRGKANGESRRRRSGWGVDGAAHGSAAGALKPPALIPVAAALAVAAVVTVLLVSPGTAHADATVPPPTPRDTKADAAAHWRARLAPGLAESRVRTDARPTSLATPTASAQSRIIADPSAPGSQRPTVLSAPNGTPLVNITQ